MLCSCAVASFVVVQCCAAVAIHRPCLPFGVMIMPVLQSARCGWPHTSNRHSHTGVRDEHVQAHNPPIPNLLCVQCGGMLQSITHYQHAKCSRLASQCEAWRFCCTLCGDTHTSSVAQLVHVQQAVHPYTAHEVLEVAFTLLPAGPRWNVSAQDPSLSPKGLFWTPFVS